MRRRWNDDEARVRALLSSGSEESGREPSVCRDEQYARVRKRIREEGGTSQALRLRPSDPGVWRPGRAVASVAAAVFIGLAVLAMSSINDLFAQDGPAISDGGDDEGAQLGVVDVELVHMVDHEANRLLHEAYETLVVECMEEAGFKRWPEPFTGSHPWRGVVVVTDNTPYVLSATEAARHGYGRPMHEQESTRRPRETSPNRPYIDSLSPSESEAYHAAALGSSPPDDDWIIVEHPDGSGTGTAPDGCINEARERLFGDLGAYMSHSYVPTNIAHLAASEARSDAAVRAKVDDWQVCMKDSGYAEVGDPDEAIRGAIKARSEGQESQSGEVSRAEAHADCLTVTSLRDTFQQTYERALADLHAEHKTEIRAFEDIQAEAVAEARRILGERPGST